jgi:predicted transcriptional regulator of viral defense system
MTKLSPLTAIKQLRRPVFTTREIAACCGSSLSNIVQALRHLEKKRIVFQIARGVWGLDLGKEKFSAYSAIPFLLPHRAYVSFISALHLHGLIEQIPQGMTLASTTHTKTLRTKLGTYHVHQISPAFFKGFDWYKGSGSFLIAQPEKALVDCLYLSARKKRQFGYFPELSFPKSFDFNKARKWASAISDPKIRSFVRAKLEALLSRCRGP